LPSVTEEKLLSAFKSGKVTVRIAGPIQPAESKRLRELHLPYTFLEPRTWRIYPGKDLAAQVLGYVQDGEGGIYGVERTHNKQLAGKPGSFTAETDLNGNPLTVGASSGQPATNGADLTLTIDSTMQYIVQTVLAERVKELKAHGGTVVVMNARSGAIVAMAGEPTFDPNNYSKYYDKRGCLGSQNVYFNPALTCAYEPGSVMKTVTMAAALDLGLVTPDTMIHDPGYVTFADAPIVRNWAHKAYGDETMTGILEHSANVGVAILAHDFLKAEGFYS
jgi:cell division protein FtsI/penicillin-binding protein 2